MIDKSVGFARYSKALSWVVALICLLVSILTFTGSSSNATLLGFLWLGVAIAFSLSAIFLAGGGRPNQQSGNDSGES